MANLQTSQRISANELRIGNWVFLDFSTLCKTDYFPIKISCVYLEQLEGPDYKISPIPLTPEILDKIGDRKYIMDSNITAWKIGDFLYAENDFALSKGLHWFQNYHYFRTGEELEINL